MGTWRLMIGACQWWQLRFTIGFLSRRVTPQIISSKWRVNKQVKYDCYLPQSIGEWILKTIFNRMFLCFNYVMCRVIQIKHMSFSVWKISSPNLFSKGCRLNLTFGDHRRAFILSSFILFDYSNLLWAPKTCLFLYSGCVFFFFVNQVSEYLCRHIVC